MKPVHLLLCVWSMCIACSASPKINVGNEPDGSVAGSGGASGSAGLGGFGGGDNTLTALITAPPSEMAIEVITIGCAGECKQVLAVARGGNPGYTFIWSDGVTTAAREICAGDDTTFTVTVSDTAIVDSEFPYAAQTASASVRADVIGCEPLPDGGVACAAGAGRYVGTFTCSLGGVPFTGPLDLTLTGTQSGTSLMITNGRLNGSAFGLVPFTADIVGMLDCGSSELEASLENGQTPAEAFGGTMRAVYDPIGGPALNGTWDLQSLANATTRCDGTWSATLQP